MFDIAAASIFLGEDVLVASLGAFADEAQVALRVTRAMDPDFARTIMSALMIRADYADLEGTAQSQTCRVLERIVAQAGRLER